jgi:hypothetical protein
MGTDGAFDLRGIDVLPARHDHVVGPVAEVEVAVLVEVADVAETGEPIPEAPAGLLGVLEVTLHQEVVRHPDLAGLARVHRMALPVQDADLDARDRTPDGALAAVLVLGARHRDPSDLGPSVQVVHDVAEEPPGFRSDLGREPRTGAHHDLQ